MSEAFCAAIDWGTSSFRLWLLAQDGTVLDERRSDEGLLAVERDGFGMVMERHLADAGAAERLPVVICGMAGSRQGWQEADYLDVPAVLTAVADRAVRVGGQTRDVRILPGIAQRDAHRPDVMRGEETQLLGALGAAPEGSFVCMPGTHSKWVRLAKGRVDAFATFMTGELFDAIGRHTILAHALGKDEAVATRPAFAKAVRRALETDASMLNELFAIRSGQLLGFADGDEGRAGLSGTLIGAEIAGARRVLGASERVMLIASGGLDAPYHAALEIAGMEIEMADADDAVRRGLLVAACRMWSGGTNVEGMK